MSKDVLPIEIRGVVPANAGVAIFVGNEKKVFIINVDPYIGDVIVKLMNGVQRERPLTHDLLGSVFKGFGIAVERVVITELKNATYFARLILKQQNELGQAIVELDARPSDCLALAIAQKIALTWPVSGANYQLEYRNDLNSTNWHAYTNSTPVVIDGQTTVLVAPAVNAQQYYRLRKTN